LSTTLPQVKVTSKVGIQDELIQLKCRERPPE